MNTWDPSVIGITPDEMECMSAEEQRERMIEEMNRAADIIQAVESAFGYHMSQDDRYRIHVAAEEIIGVTRASEEG